MKGYINSIESFGAVDGPGVRFVFFLQGCRMRCKYCHNPETWRLPDEMLWDRDVAGSDSEGAASVPKAPWREAAGEKYEVKTAQEAFDQAFRYHAYWKNGGGITVSGGEGLLQIDFVTELFRIAKEHGVHTALDTSGQPFTREEPFFSKFRELMKYTDLFILDIKHIDSAAHKLLTGWDNTNILDLASYLSEQGKAMWIRHVLLPGVTTDEKELKDLRAFLDTLKTVERVEVLPYHTMGKAKYEKLGIRYPLPDTASPDADEIAKAEELLKAGRQ
jgi:pyruvate formate lyase activating enzyme